MLQPFIGSSQLTVLYIWCSQNVNNSCHSHQVTLRYKVSYESEVFGSRFKHLFKKILLNLRTTTERPTNSGLVLYENYPFCSTTKMTDFDFPTPTGD